jgi:hypothetical protein
VRRDHAALLLAIFGGKEKMIESPLLQELIAEQRAEARVETTHKIILRCLKARFGLVPDETGTALKAFTDEHRWEQLVEQAALSPDLDAFRRALAQ